MWDRPLNLSKQILTTMSLAEKLTQTADPSAFLTESHGSLTDF